MQDLVPLPEVKPGPPGLQAQSLNHWTTLYLIFETENYVFVHSFFPFDIPNWRTEASKRDWEEARWGNPFTLSLATDLNKALNGKTLVFGHWHTSWAREHIDGIEPEYPEDKDYLPYYGKNFIGLDACTPLSKRVNVIVLEDNFMEKSNA